MSCSRSVLELIPLGVDAVTVAFRLGLRVADVAQRLDLDQSMNRSWSVVVADRAAAQSLNEFCGQTVSQLASYCQTVECF